MKQNSNGSKTNAVLWIMLITLIVILIQVFKIRVQLIDVSSDQVETEPVQELMNVIYLGDIPLEKVASVSKTAFRDASCIILIQDYHDEDIVHIFKTMECADYMSASYD